MGVLRYFIKKQNNNNKKKAKSRACIKYGIKSEGNSTTEKSIIGNIYYRNQAAVLRPSKAKF